ncbi:MAG: DNA methylase, partial [Clostridia bacterium]|nr:DNA methylase [Clostridia bacterium]
EITTDRYGRRIPKQAHGSINLGSYTSSTKKIMQAVTELYDRIVDKNLLVRRMYLVANHVVESGSAASRSPVQLDLFTDLQQAERENAELEKERSAQEAVISIQKKYGKNALVRGMNMEEGATTRERNGQIGGHKK